MRRKLHSALLAVFFVTGMAVKGAAQEGYLLQPGDVLEVAVSGLPEMTMRAPIQIDGRLNVPGVGVIEAAGATLRETREAVQTAIASQLLPVYLPDGREVMRTVNSSQVTVSVVEYRPIFVTGDVMHPGQLPYRPGMTVRQAIAAAGGAGISRDPMQRLDPLALRIEYSEAWHAATAASARVWRLNFELGREGDFPRDVWPTPPGPGTTLDDILNVEISMAETRSSVQHRHMSFLDQQISQIDAQMVVLKNQLTVEQAQEELDAESLAEADAARERGVVTNSRLNDIRSAALISATRRLQTEVSFMQMARRRTELEHERATVDDSRRLEILDELQQARVVEGRERARLSGAEERLRTARMSLPGIGRSLGDPEFEIVRANETHRISNALETQVRPGDVVSVTYDLDSEPLLRSSPKESQHLTSELR